MQAKLSLKKTAVMDKFLKIDWRIIRTCVDMYKIPSEWILDTKLHKTDIKHNEK